MLIIEMYLNNFDLFYDDITDMIVLEQTDFIDNSSVLKHYQDKFPRLKEKQEAYVKEYVNSQQNIGLFGSALEFKLTDAERHKCDYDYINTIYNTSVGIRFLNNGLNKVCKFAENNNLESLIIFIKKRPEIINGAGFAMFETLAATYSDLDITIRLY